MKETTVQMKPIWYFVGIMLLSMGGVIFLTGLYLLIAGVQPHTILGESQPDIWWGAVMMVAGGVFYFFNRTPKTE